MIHTDDHVLVQIMLHRAHPDVPKAIAQGAFWTATLLLALRSWSSIGKIAEVARLPDGRFAASIDGRWAVTFAWDYDMNRAFHLRLEHFT